MSKKTLAKKTSLGLLRLIIGVFKFVFTLLKPSNFFLSIYRRWERQVSGERLRKGKIFFQAGTLLIGLIMLGVSLFIAGVLKLSFWPQVALVVLSVSLVLRIFTLRFFTLPDFAVTSSTRYGRDLFPATNFSSPILGFSEKGLFKLDLKNKYSGHIAIFGNPSEYRDSLNFLLVSTFLENPKACVLALDAAAGGVEYGVLRRHENNGLIVATEPDDVQKTIAWLRTELDKRLREDREHEPLFIFLDEELSASVLSDRQDSTTLLITKIAQFGRKANILLVINAWPDKSYRDLRRFLPFFMTISFAGTSFISEKNQKAVTIPDYADVAGVYLDGGLLLVKFIKSGLSNVSQVLGSRNGNSVTWKLAKKALGGYKDPEIVGEVANGSPWLQAGV